LKGRLRTKEVSQRCGGKDGDGWREVKAFSLVLLSPPNLLLFDEKAAL
jgi:hypothetical protein